MAIRQRIRSLLWRVPIEQEVHDELTHHAELRERELIERGVPADEARRKARERIANGRVEAELTNLGRQRNESWSRRDWIDELRQDLTFAWRQCRTKPGFTLAAVWSRRPVHLLVAMTAASAFDLQGAVVLNRV